MQKETIVASASKSLTINAPANVLWQAVGDFNGWSSFIEVVVKSEMRGTGVGAVRAFTLADGAVVEEKLESFDDDNCALSYSIVSGPLPVKNYLATIAVNHIDDDNCRVDWSSTFEPDGVSEEEAVAAIEGIYSANFEGLQKLFGS